MCVKQNQISIKMKKHLNYNNLFAFLKLFSVYDRYKQYLHRTGNLLVDNVQIHVVIPQELI